ncbi:MAG: 2-hydroxyacyl-CoA dehydratase family protein [Puniceicoccales bacterium]|jgi:benzoyl-CoA reductase/2-hydroxyglutaryl-CoA dehydratase subunit BcrC/BadD/HgdB|nr:2-hydroxyacyl-CoA dehydratase family protein [Puniceicoccales bacterium]
MSLDKTSPIQATSLPGDFHAGDTVPSDAYAPGTVRHGSLTQPDLYEAKDERPFSRTVIELGELAAGWNLARIEELVRTENRRAVFGGFAWDSPLLRATGTIGVSIMELWRKDSKRAERIAERDYLVPPEFCSMIKTMIGRWDLLNASSPIRRILAFSSSCEPIGMVLEHARNLGYEIHTLEGATAFKTDERPEATVKFLANEIHKAGAWLQDGKPLDEERLGEEIRRKNAALRKVARILDLRLKRPFDIGSLPTMWLLGGTSGFFGDYERFDNILDRLIAELESAAKTPETRPYLPLILAGAPPGGLSFFKLLEEHNAVIVGLVLLGTALYREDVPPAESLAHYLFDSQLRGELGEATGASATLRRRGIEALIEKTGAKGLVSSAVTACPYASLLQQIERNYFRNKNFPLVALEHSVHNEPITEEQTMKIKAFLEQLTGEI